MQVHIERKSLPDRNQQSEYSSHTPQSLAASARGEMGVGLKPSVLELWQKLNGTVDVNSIYRLLSPEVLKQAVQSRSC